MIAREDTIKEAIKANLELNYNQLRHSEANRVDRPSYEAMRRMTDNTLRMVLRDVQNENWESLYSRATETSRKYRTAEVNFETRLQRMRDKAQVTMNFTGDL